jgi:ATP:ADP antiporter, AAA family
MLPRIRRFFDVRSGEGLRVLLSFLYVAVVVAAFLLAKPIRNSLFLRQYGPYSLVYVYAAVPLALTLFVPIYTRIAARLGSRVVTVGTLVFFSFNVLLFWYGFRALTGARAERGSLGWLLPGVFYVWVNCFGVIAPVQAWTFASSLFDTRQARRLFGLIGAGASLGAVSGGLLARFLVGPVGGTVNMMLVLAALILIAAGIVATAHVRLRRTGPVLRGRPPTHPFSDSIRQIGRSPYLRLLAALVFLVAVSTQWTAFQLSLIADARFQGNADALTKFFGTFNFAMGAVTFAIQLLLSGPALRRFGVAATILILPFTLGAGSSLILLVPAFWPVLFANACDQGFRFSVDKSTYELLYLPLAPAQRGPVKNAIDIVVSRVADAAGAVMLGYATRGFFMLDGLGLGLRGTAAVNLVVISAWLAVAWRLRGEYVRTIQQSIHRHRIDAERASLDLVDQSAVATIEGKLASQDALDVREALETLESQGMAGLEGAVRRLLDHEEPDVRRRALALLSAAGDKTIGAAATRLLRDTDVAVRTEALLYVTREMGADPLRQLEELGEFEDFSIRAGLAAFLASPGPSQNLDAARLILEGMTGSRGEAGVADRRQAARVLGVGPDVFLDLLTRLIQDPDTHVAREAILSARRTTAREIIAPLLDALGEPDLAADAAAALARYGDALVPALERLLHDSHTSLVLKRELPAVLLRIGTPLAQQVLIDGLLQSDVTLRHRVVTSLNKLHDAHPDVRIDSQLIELLLAAEIAGHYRSYQVLGPLRSQLKADDVVLKALQQTMEQELERIFRLMALLFNGPGLHDAYVGIRSGNQTVRANALEFLDNVLKPELRTVLVPLLDSQVSVEERIKLANRLVGAPLETAEQAVGTLLGSEDAWLRSCAMYAVGALQLHGLEGELRRFETSTDPRVRDAAQAARQRLVGDADATPPLSAPGGMTMGVG